MTDKKKDAQGQRKLLIFTVKKAEDFNGGLNFLIRTNETDCKRVLYLSPALDGDFPKKGKGIPREGHGMVDKFREFVARVIKDLNLTKEERANCQLKFSDEYSFSFAPEICGEGFKLQEEWFYMPMKEYEIRFFVDCLRRAIILIPQQK